MKIGMQMSKSSIAAVTNRSARFPAAVLAAAAFSVVTLPVPASAAGPAPRPEVFRKLIDCRKLVDPQARLACFDTNAAAVDAAEANKEIVLFDRQAVSKARKTLFGLTLPTFDMFGDKSEGAKEEEEGFSSIESVVKGVQRNGDGKYVLTLEDGAKWVQVERKQLISDPAPGSKIRIRRAALGSFLANIDGQTAIRMRREN